MFPVRPTGSEAARLDPSLTRAGPPGQVDHFFTDKMASGFTEDDQEALAKSAFVNKRTKAFRSGLGFRFAIVLISVKSSFHYKEFEVTVAQQPGRQFTFSADGIEFCI